MKLRGKVVLITGAAQGLGQKMAELLAEQGANLALTDLDRAKLVATGEACARRGSGVRDYVANVTEESSVVQMFQSVQHDLGGVDGVDNNAGINSDGLLVKVVGGRVQGMSPDTQAQAEARAKALKASLAGPPADLRIGGLLVSQVGFMVSINRRGAIATL